ncbi:hypothetical protein QVD17_17109 [Tagetes erecta]|uniref:Mitochondrial Rho GTPase n=1 Tax=Tagetes erecta TaxID=13708 RepID=A0AAD8KSK2_TARER|nr:hypothetical protein QVD17_17109 [Tagetes erecta]
MYSDGGEPSFVQKDYGDGDSPVFHDKSMLGELRIDTFVVVVSKVGCGYICFEGYHVNQFHTIHRSVRDFTQLLNVKQLTTRCTVSSSPNYSSRCGCRSCYDIDAASSLEGKAKVEEELKRADAVVLTYACDRAETLNRLQTFWIPEVHRLKAKAPLIVVGCKLDLRDEHFPMSLELVMAPIMQQFREIETCIECSAANLVQVPEVFYHAQKAVLHPTAPLFDQETQTLKPRCIRALKRIFILCDHDMMVKCFNAPLQPAEIVGVKRVVRERVPEGVNDRGLSCSPDQSIELTSEAMDFLMGIFSLFDSNNDGALQDSELDELFSTSPESPWDDAPYKSSVERTESGDIRLSGFLSQTNYHIPIRKTSIASHHSKSPVGLNDNARPRKSLAYLIYLGYTNDPATALRVTRKRTLDVKKQQSDRHAFQCFVFGPKSSGKSSLLRSLVGRPFQNSHGLTSNQSYTVNAVDQLQGAKKTLILHDQEDDVKQFLSSKDSLAACDVAIFVYDSSDEYSLKRASELLMDVARRVLIPMATRDSEAICQELKIDAPIRISVKKRAMNNIIWRIVNAVERCHLSVPETEHGRNMKQYHCLVNRSLMLASVGAAAAVIGLAAYRTYASRKGHSAS